MTFRVLPGSLAYGGDYNPEQWDPATIDEDIALMKKAGINLVTVGVFAWSLLEPEENRYEFDWLDTVISTLSAAGIAVDLATATASPPAWMAVNHPETCPVNADGVRLGFGSRQQYCPTNAFYRKKAAQLAGALADRYGTNPAVKLWHIGNEYGCHIWECFCDGCAAAFRTWLEAKYDGSIDRLNEAWGTAFWSQRYIRFSDISVPKAMPTFPNPGQMLDWRRFTADSLLQCYLTEYHVLRPKVGATPITTNFMSLFPMTDYWSWAEHVDIAADDSYPDPATGSSAAQVAFEADLLRSLKRQPFLLMEQTPASVQWRSVNSPKRPRQNRLWSIERVARGADGILHFQWRQSKQGAETFHSGMIPHQGPESRIYQEIIELGDTLQALAPVANTFVEKAPIGLLWSWESEWARTSAIGPAHHTFGTAVRSWHRTAYEQGYTVDFLNPESDLNSYPIIIVPEIFAMDDDVAARLFAAARAGSHILVAAPSAVTDTKLTAYLGNGLGPLEEITGVRVIEQWPASQGRTPFDPDLLTVYSEPDPTCDRITRAVTAPSGRRGYSLRITDPEFAAACHNGLISPAGSVWGELIAPASTATHVLAIYDGGAGAGLDLHQFPAITTCPHEKGSCVYVSTDATAPTRTALLNLVCRRAGVNPVVACLPDGVEAIRRGEKLFLLNHSDETATVVVTQADLPDLSGDTPVTDLLTGMEWPTLPVTVTVEPLDAVVLGGAPR